jgi:phage terminase large subunit-like protein
VDLYKWIKKGYVIECDTKTVDYEVVFSKIEHIADRFNVQRLYYDGYNAAPINNRIEQLGIETKAIPQTAMHYNQPIKYLEKMLFEDQLVLSENPVMTWNFGNAVLYEDGNGNVKFLKNKSRDSIDGLVSLAMAMKAWLVDHNEDEAAFMGEYKELMKKM